MNRLPAVLTLVLLLSLAACTQAPPAAPPDTRAADQKTIMDGETAWSADMNSKDIEKIVSHYADDAILMDPDMPATKGKDAIRAGLKSFLADKNFALSFVPTAVEASKSGDLAYSYGTYTLTMTNPKTKKPVTGHGKYATVYRKQADGSWKAILDINNADAPAK
jgi:ketosteroid isomerase-like protein